jgi:hypothetical protein
MPNILVQLKVERERVARQLRGLDSAISALSGSRLSSNHTRRPGRRTKLSAKALANIRKAQRERWARWRATQRKAA